MNNKTKVLIIHEKISHYLIPLFEKLSKKMDFTVMHSDYDAKISYNFKTFFYDKKVDNIFDATKNYDVIICSPNFENLNLLKLLINKRNKKIIYYGIGVSASYQHQYDSNKIVALFFSIILRFMDAAIFYSDYPIKKYVQMGIKKNKLFSSNNTVEVQKININPIEEKQNIIFVGTLYKEKGLDFLLNSYRSALDRENNLYDLLIIGDGPEKKEIVKMISSLRLSKKVKMIGSIYEEAVLSNYFNESIICVSPKQAGLTVLKSMGYGVPFITTKNAITGGEIFNIKEDNGIIMEDIKELEQILLDSYWNKEKYYKMGINAQNYYYQNCTIDNSVRAFLRAIDVSVGK